MRNVLLELYKSPLTVFTIKDVALLLNEDNMENLKARIYYHVKKQRLLSLRKGIYAKKDYNIFEVANKIYTPSYISLETILRREGMIFQHYETIFLISYLSREIKVQEKIFRYRKIKNQILTHPLGLKEENSVTVASLERAFLDVLYLYKEYFFDNLRPLNKDKIDHLLQEVYKSKKLEKRVKEILKHA